MITQNSIIIIGGGASGTLLTINLLKSIGVPLKITVVNSHSESCTGVAYSSSYSEKHLLNVTAGKMSALPSEPNHFVNWLKNKPAFEEFDVKMLEKSFVPRKYYGQYLVSVFTDTIKEKSDIVNLEQITGRVINVLPCEHGYQTILANGRKLHSRFIVLATGNALPRNPDISNRGFFSSPRYLNNPWDLAFANNLQPDNDVLIIGNGLTMVDTVQTLIERKYKGVVYSLSPHGFGILPHSHTGLEDKELIDQIKDIRTLRQLVSICNRRIKKVKSLGLSIEPVVESLRPLSQKLWSSLTDADRKLFMSRLRHLWGAVRHRLPISIYHLVDQLKATGKLKICSGRLLEITERKKENDVFIEFFDKKTKSRKSLSVGMVINCTGPETDPGKMNDLLFSNLISEGLISVDKLRIGIKADEETMQVFNERDEINIDFFALGGLLRGTIWETTAIPELRTQAAAIADQILQKAIAEENLLSPNNEINFSDASSQSL